jgi:branched-chain amino acid transport system ATP-binding protein
VAYVILKCSLGLSPLLVDEFFRIIKQVREEGLTVLLVEQNVHKSLEIADRAYVLENGHITLEGKSGELLEDERIRKAYLGL